MMIRKTGRSWVSDASLALAVLIYRRKRNAYMAQPLQQVLCYIRKRPISLKSLHDTAVESPLDMFSQFLIISSFLQTRDKMWKWLYITSQSQHSGMIGFWITVLRKRIYDYIQTETIEVLLQFYDIKFLMDRRILIFLWLRASNFYFLKMCLLICWGN